MVRKQETQETEIWKTLLVKYKYWGELLRSKAEMIHAHLQEVKEVSFFCFILFLKAVCAAMKAAASFNKASEKKAECNHQVHKMLVTWFLPAENSHKGWPLAPWALL